MEQFDVPVVLFIFKRDKAVEIIRRIACVKPKRLYILADEGRNDEEKTLVAKCRKAVESAIDWDCEVIKSYALENRGVYENIAEGAKWVLRREKWAIFLEDDNLPELTFFSFCREMLMQYENDTRVLWVCGTNYLGKYEPEDGVSYVFTRHMLPCGWASWSAKFEQFYDGELSLCEDESVMKRIPYNYCNKAVYEQYSIQWQQERKRIVAGEKPISWDYQMDFAIKANGLFGICPCNNQIKNIGVDEYSAHGGTSFSWVMTRRFCGMDSYPIEYPLKHPKTVMVDPVFETAIGEIILLPLSVRIKDKMKYYIVRSIKFILRIPAEESVRKYFKR